jgi:threonine dehydrogenase-like Zn-dependent dehydrogenase
MVTQNGRWGLFAGNIYEPRKIKLIDVPEFTLDSPSTDNPSTGANGDAEIIFQPELACLCGSDLLFFEGDYKDYPPEVGQSLHEMIGRVVETNGSRFKPGDRVLCVPVDHFGFYERFRVSEQRAIPLDPRPPEEEALVAQPLGTVLYGMKKVPPVLDKDVVIVGQGPIGQLFAATIRNLGARQIIAIDILGSRLKRSGEMGATAVINASQDDAIARVRDLTGGAMADLVVEAVGHREQRLNDCFQLVRHGGDILFFGVPTLSVDDIHIRELFYRNASLHTSVGPSFERDFSLAMQWIAEGRIDVSPVVTHRFPVEDIQEAFDTFAERRDGALKVFVDFPR